MTFRQAVNIANGYNKKVKSERDYLLSLMREIYALMYNQHPITNKKPKNSSQLFPLDSEKGKVIPNKNYIPLKAFVAMFNAFRKGKNDNLNND
jgi:hypothetical protein